MNKITLGFFKAKSKTTIKGLLVLFVLLLLNTQWSWGQTQSFLGLDGGFEGSAIIDNVATGTTTAVVGKWSKANTNITIANETSTIRSGVNSLKVNSSTSTTSRVLSPIISMSASTTKWVVQYYRRSTSTMNTVQFQGGNQRGSAESLSGTYAGVSVANTWEKLTYAPTSVTSVASGAALIFCKMLGTGGDVFLDDICLYESLNGVDVTNPLAPSAPVVSNTIGNDATATVSWTASSDIDGGGYMVVRYAANPNADNDPNINGIYSVGNLITNGTSSLVGRVVYVGTAISFLDSNFTDDGNYYYKIYSFDKAFNYSNEITSNALTMDLPTTWTTAWSNGDPESTKEAIIDGTYLTTSGAFECKKLTVNANKALTINSGTTIKVVNNVVNNGTVTLESNANLIQVNNVANTGSGTFIVTRNSNPLKRLDYTLWSCPVTGTQTLAAFSPETSQSPSRFYTYNPGTNLYDAIDATTTPFSAGAGYLIRMPNTADAVIPAVYSGVFTGLANNGTVKLSSLTSDRFYAVGNPYPSTIDASAFLTLPGNTTDGTLYFWRKTNGVSNIAGSSATGTAYATWTTLGAAASEVAPNNVVPNGTIQVGQGFIVKSTGSSLTFTNAMRLGTVSTQFFKTKQLAGKSRIWLNLTNTSGVFSQALIGYVDGATLGVDAGIDGKYINDSAIALTSNINNEEYTIQGRPAFETSDIVALNFKTDVTGDYSIAIDQVDGLFASGQDIYLVDSKTGTEINLKGGVYNFTANAGIDNSRFYLKYQKTLKVADSALNDNSVIVYKNKGTLYVNSSEKAINSIKVYDVQGRLLEERNNIKANTASFSNLKASNQILIVKVHAEDKSEVTKKVAN